jgi:hypothetical protein
MCCTAQYAQGRKRPLAVLTEGDEVRRFLRAIDKPTELPSKLRRASVPYA